MSVVLLAALSAATVCLSLAAVAPPGGVLHVDPRSVVRARRRRRDGEASAMPVLEALVAASRAGIVLPDALAIARDRARGELADRLDAALARDRLGVALADAIAGVEAGASARVATLLADLELCARSRLSSDRVAAFLDDALGTRRFERELASDLAARTSGQRFQVWLLAAVVPALAVYLAAMSPTLADELASPLGRFVLVPAGLLFELAGVVLSRHVVERACR